MAGDAEPLGATFTSLVGAATEATAVGGVEMEGEVVIDVDTGVLGVVAGVAGNANVVVGVLLVSMTGALVCVTKASAF